jgi:MFS transporter, DHA2 family, multidrug resistance protein
VRGEGGGGAATQDFAGRPGGVPNRAAITVSIMLANIMQGLDTTIANVALPHIQGSLSATQDQVAWVLTSYIVTAAIMMPLTGWLAGRFGIKYVFLWSVIGFTLASALCGSATSLTQLVVYRALQGIAGAGLIPLAQAVLLRINPVERHGQAMAVFGIGAMLGPTTGPALGGWITQDYSWRMIFYINVPIGIISALGILIFIRERRHVRREHFDFFGFAVMSIAIGALQMMLDRGEFKDWFGSTEIWIEAAIAAIGFYLLVVHTMTAGERSFLSHDLLRTPNFITATILMFFIGLLLNGTLALLPTMLQALMGYPVLTTGLVTMSRGVGTMIAMILVGRIINHVDSRLIILAGLLVAAFSMWQMTGFTLMMGSGPVIISGLLQGFGLGVTFVPLNTLALSTLPRSILTQGTALRSLMRNLGGSIGIAILEAQFVENTQIVHSRLVEGLRPDNLLARPPALPAPYSLSNPSGVVALNDEVTRQASMVGYIDAFQLMLLIIVFSLPLLFLLRRQPQFAAAE